MTAAGLEDFNIIGMGGSSVASIVAMGVALFLRQKWVEKQDNKKARESGSSEKPVSEWLRSFLEAMTEDRREMKDLFRELTHELRSISVQIERMSARLEAQSGTMVRLESKADALLQRKTG